MRLVIDTNILLAAIPDKSRLHPIYKALIAGQHEWVISHEILMEYLEILEERAVKGAGTIIEAVIRNLRSVRIVDPHYRWQLIRDDYDDNKFTDAYVAGQADYLVTNDRHFSILRKIDWPPIRVISADELLALINPESKSE